MAFSERTKSAMNDQLMREIEASYAYLSMAEYCQSKGLHGFGGWLEAQSQEEWEHAMRFRSFIQDRGEAVRFESVREPVNGFTSVIDVFQRALEQERAVTQYINDLYALAQDEKDFATLSFLNWFVDEQVEEEKSVMGIIDWIRALGDSPQGIYLLDRELGGSLEAGVTSQGGPPETSNSFRSSSTSA
jgi:ferritin